MIADSKERLHHQLRVVREALIWKLDGLSEYDVRRPMTATGTNLLGLVKHRAYSDARYFGDVFGRPFPGPVPTWNAPEAWKNEHWAAEDETRAEILALHASVCAHADATIEALTIDAPGHVPWWPQPDVQLFTIMVHSLTDTTRHAGHADILREQLDGRTGTTAEYESVIDFDARESHRALLEEAARAAHLRSVMPN
ncbi:MAG: DinB family protein [Hamadaea sp.]|uniref:DinB family protein n=1 Tax=Hamadaea sp. TaxID=2024425 RepID=UPI0018023477|nr:DinB family protein [Hamadaea sp.]NUR74414.1 DinB family protein [Hamadaea sp.]NUT22934.1 DinB family protein [Hamadaea sp.]